MQIYKELNKTKIIPTVLQLFKLYSLAEIVSNFESNPISTNS